MRVVVLRCAATAEHLGHLQYFRGILSFVYNRMLDFAAKFKAKREDDFHMTFKHGEWGYKLFNIIHSTG